MRITVLVGKKKIEVDVDEQTFSQLKGEINGYQYNETSPTYCQDVNGKVFTFNTIIACKEHCDLYKTANFYKDREVAENNARADELMRKLRRFAADNGGCEKQDTKTACVIDYYNGDVHPSTTKVHSFGSIRFVNFDVTIKAIEKYHDELIWYFTEYDPMPKGWWDDA